MESESLLGENVSTKPVDFLLHLTSRHSQRQYDDLRQGCHVGNEVSS